MNTIAASTSRIPRIGLIAIATLVVAFVALMVVRSGLVGGSKSESVSVPTTPRVAVKPVTPRTTPAKPTVVLLPGLPAQVAAKLRFSKVVVVSVYLSPAAGDRPAVTAARMGARESGAGFVAVDVARNKNAQAINSFVGPVSSPTMLVVRRPGTVVTKMSGALDSAIVAQAAHNAGARRR